MRRNLRSFLKLLGIFLFLVISQKTFAQRVTVSGKVLGLDSGEPLVGVNVVVKAGTPGTTTEIAGTITDINGEFRIEADQSDILVFSYVGYLPEEIPIGNQTFMTVNLVLDIQQLGEVVVIGYGSLKEKDLTSAIATVKAEEIVKTPTSQAMQALQGKVAGVQIVSNGAPGASPTVRVRGIGSFESDAAPLYVVDGMFFSNIDFLNPNDIETMSILKDASASAIYGVRAANGVVLIETKSGQYDQSPEIVYDGYYGVQNPQNVIKMANSAQFVQYINEVNDPADLTFIDNAMQRYGRSTVNPNVPNVNTDWYKEVMSPAPIQNHTLSFNGGSQSTRYSLGASYFRQEGLLNKTRNDYSRFNVRLKIDTDIKKWLKVGGNINVSTVRQYVGENSAWFRTYFAVPIIPVYDDQNVDATPEQLSNAQQIGYRDNQNPFYSLLYEDNRNDIGKVLGNFNAEISFIPDKLTFKTAYNYDLESRNTRNVDFAFFDGVRDFPSSIRKENFNIYNLIWDNFLTYTNDFGKHNLTLVGGYSYRSESNNILFMRGEEISPDPNRNNEEFWYITRALNLDVNDIGDTNDETLNSRLFFQSLFARVAYNYDGRYLFYSTYRRDGNNKFQKKWGDFFTVGAGWVLSEENFFNVGFIDFLKLRASWGQLGNDGIEPAVGAPTLEPTETALGDVLVRGRRLNPTFDLVEQWETTEETNIGLSSNFFQNRLSLEFDYFIRDTKNLAVAIIPPVFRATERRSVGEIRNTGVELTLNWNGKISGDWSYSIGGNLATLRNQVRSLGGPDQLLAGSAEFRQISRIGDPFEAFFGYDVLGVFQNNEQINSSGYTPEFISSQGLEPGDFYFKDQNGDGIIDDEDRVILGSIIPSLNYGFNFGLTYRQFSLTANFQGQSGHSILNRKRGQIIFTNDANLDAELISNLWRGEGTSSKYPSAAGLRKGWNQNMSSYFVESGSYFRIQNVRLVYDVLNRQSSNQDIVDIKIILTAERPLTVFNYNGFNPEVPNGIDTQTYPIPAVYTLGLNLKF